MIGSAARPHVAVIGGGVIGVCSASWLLREGYRVTILEAEEIAGGSSSGNAGCLNPSSMVPMSMPGNLLKIPTWLLNPLGPLSIRWQYLPAIAPWLLRFVKAGRRDRVLRQAAALTGLLKDSPDVYAPLLDNANARDFVRRDGHLVVYRERAEYEAEAFAWQLRRDNGIEYSMLENEALWELEPAVSRDFRFGIFFANNGHIINPQRLVTTLAEACQRDGAQIKQAKVLGFEVEAGRLIKLRTSVGDLPFDRAVVAAGAYSKPLAKALGDAVPLDTERGYHLVISQPEAVPRFPVLDMAGKFMATPMEMGLRLAGTVEFAGLKAAPDWRRADKLLTLGSRLFPALKDHYTDDRLSRWMDFRPSMPDSLPVIGHASRTRDVVYAFGHGHVGMIAGAKTGHLVADLLAGRTPQIPLGPFSARRFIDA